MAGFRSMDVGAGGVPVEAYFAQATGAGASTMVPVDVSAAAPGVQPMMAPWASDDVFVGRRGHDCQETTKKGAACRSKAIGGTNLCVGHWRVAIAYADAIEAEETEADPAEAQAEVE